MSENPYQAPLMQPNAVGVLSGTRKDLLSVAKCQKGVIGCILTYLMLVIGQFMIPTEVRHLILYGVVVVGIVGAGYVFLLATKVYGIVLGFFLGLLTLVPLIGLPFLLIVNGKATRVLKQNGIKIGLLGANLAQFPGAK